MVYDGSFCKKDGFTFLVNASCQTLILDRKRFFRKGVDYAIENGIDKIEVVLDLTEKELALLKQVPLKELTLRGSHNDIDISIVNEFTTLEYFSSQSTVHGEIDLINFQNLIGLCYDATYLDVINLEKSNSLKELSIYNYRRKELMPFGNSKLEDFFIHNSSITDLDALSDCLFCKKIVVENNHYLRSIDGIRNSASGLEELALRNCKHFSDYKILHLLSNLKDLYLCNCGEMKNTSFFSELKNLVYGYIDINIVDGNVDLLMQMPIIFKNYRHFNRKNNLKIKVVMNDGNYLVRDKQTLYKLND